MLFVAGFFGAMCMVVFGVGIAVGLVLGNDWWIWGGSAAAVVVGTCGLAVYCCHTVGHSEEEMDKYLSH